MTIGAFTSPFATSSLRATPDLRALAVAEPADARRQPLELDALPRHASIQRRRCSSSGKSSSTSSSVRAMSAGSPESATQRNGPLPSQKSGRM